MDWHAHRLQQINVQVPESLQEPEPVVIFDQPEETIDRSVVPLSQRDYIGVATEKQVAWKNSSKKLSTLQEEVLRILDLPFIKEDMLICTDPQAFHDRWVKPGADFRLRQVQIDTCYTFSQMGGAVGPIGVGYGKTIISLLCSAIAIEERGHHKACIMVPPEVLDQLLHTDLPKAKEVLNIDHLSFIPVTGSKKDRKEAASWSMRCIYIYTYSSLSSETGYEELILMSPTCFILDEAHKLARANTARTKRWHGAIEAIKPFMKNHPDIKATQLETVALSGTLTKKSIKDYAHVARQALGQSSPVPIREVVISLFAGVLDAMSTGTNLSETEREAFQQFLEWCYINGHNPKQRLYEMNKNNVSPTLQEILREAYRFRLTTAGGVVATSDQGVDASLLLHWVEPEKAHESADVKLMVSLMKKVAIEGKTPDGDTIDYSMHNFKWLWELTAGFYNSLVWPTIEQEQHVYMQKFGKEISTNEAEMLIEGAKRHHALLQEYHRILRHFLEGQHRPGCDSPMLVAKEIIRQLEREEPRHVLPMDLIDAYAEQKNATFNDMPERLSIPVRICDYKICNTVAWAKANVKQGGIIWYHHPNIGRWVHEYLTKEDVPHTFAPAGANKAVFNKGLIISSFAHGTGKNLQHQDNNFFIEIRREASVMEQTLGRTHRSGQMSDEVHAYMLLGNGFDIAVFNGALKDADYMQSSLGQRQRLCYATYDPVIPPTNPRLMQKLGITKKYIHLPNLASYEDVTPASMQELADAFYPTIYGNNQTIHV